MQQVSTKGGAADGGPLSGSGGNCGRGHSSLKSECFASSINVEFDQNKQSAVFATASFSQLGADNARRDCDQPGFVRSADTLPSATSSSSTISRGLSLSGRAASCRAESKV